MDIYLPLIAASGLLGLLAGFIMDRADFCMAGMFRDYFLFRDASGLRVLLLLIAASMVLLEAAQGLGLPPSNPDSLFGPPSLATLIGGAAFGVGMVLAGGCVIGTLYKMGRGSLASALTFFGLLAGSLLYGEIHPWWAEVREATLLSRSITLPQLFEVSSHLAVLLMATGAVFLLRSRLFRRGWNRPAVVAGYLQPWQAALLMAMLTLLSWLVVGMPFGVTMAYTKLGAMIEHFAFPHHMARLTFFQTPSFSYVPPFGEEVLTGGAGPELDVIAAIQFPVIAGVVLGAAVSALLLGEWQIHYRLPRRQAASALLGGIVMGIAARMAPACNVWHLLGGVPLLAGQSLLFLLGLFPGAWLGSRLLVRYVLNDKTGAR